MTFEIQHDPCLHSEVFQDLKENFTMKFVLRVSLKCKKKSKRSFNELTIEIILNDFGLFKTT